MLVIWLRGLITPPPPSAPLPPRYDLMGLVNTIMYKPHRIILFPIFWYEGVISHLPPPRRTPQKSPMSMCRGRSESTGRTNYLLYQGNSFWGRIISGKGGRGVISFKNGTECGNR